jgi:hypothetical protein
MNRTEYATSYDGFRSGRLALKRALSAGVGFGTGDSDMVGSLFKSSALHLEIRVLGRLRIGHLIPPLSCINRAVLSRKPHRR